MSNDWGHCLSDIAKSARPSPVREILKVITRPGMISFAGGMPAPDVFPVNEFAECADVLKTNGETVLQYCITEGMPELRQFIAEWSSPRMGRTVELDEIILTTGSQQGLDLVGWALLNEGDVVITEDPTYLAALSAFSNHGATFECVQTDGDGMIVEDLEALIQKITDSGRTVKLIYTIPTFQNPAGVSMSIPRRKMLAEISRKYSIPVFEDDPYGYLRYDGEHLPSVYSFDPEGMIMYAGSFSKILSPATRIGWMIADAKMLKQLTVFKQTTDLCSSTITHALAYEYCKRGYLDSHLPKILEKYVVKRDAMEESFKRHLAPLGITWHKPEGGFFFWLDFGALGIDVNELAIKALDKKVAFIPATTFCVDLVNAKRYGRFNFSYCEIDVLEEGTKRVAEAIKEMINK